MLPQRDSARPGLFWAWISLLSFVAACSSEDEPEGPPPDVIVILVDTLRSDRLGMYGSGRPTSPFLDRMAEEGAVFLDNTCQFPWTMPSVVSIHTGKYLTAFKSTLSAKDYSLAEAFRDGGYQTLGFVANGLVRSEAGFGAGFDYFESGRPGAKAKQASRTLDELREDLSVPLRDALEVEDRGEGGERAAAPGERAPLFLYLHPFDPHDPYLPHSKFNGDLPLETAERVHPEGWQLEAYQADAAVPRRPAPSIQKNLDRMMDERNRYDAEIRYTDEQLELLFAELEAWGVLDHCVVALISDHGESLWEHRTPLGPEELESINVKSYFYKTHGATVFEESIATPMVLWGTGVPGGVRRREPVENIDLFPTLLQLAGLEAPTGLHGESLLRLMEAEPQEEVPWRDHVFTHGVHGTAVRDTRTGMKLVYPRGMALDAGWKPMLFDLGDDPHERHDLSGEYPEVVRGLILAMGDWIEAHPTENLLPEGAAARAAELDQAALLRALGYTERDTGIPLDDD